MTIGRKALLGMVGACGAALAFSLERTVKAAEMQAHAAKFPWPHEGPLSSLDHASVRRGFEVFKNVCAACHGLRFFAFRRLVGFSHTEEEVKVEAADIMVTDGPNAEGLMYQRPGKLFDYWPDPYPNDEAAKHANNGVMPPDLSLIPRARHGGDNYIFSLLIGYCDAPSGVNPKEDQYYNPYFPGGIIGMPPPLYNEVMEYSDGTPATLSQMAKDVTTFFVWTAEPTHDDRKLLAIKVFTVLILLTMYTAHINRRTWSVIKNAQYQRFTVKPKGRK